MADPDGVRIAEVLAGLSLVTDLGQGQPPGEAMRACLVAMALARSAGLPEAARVDVYWATLLKYVGCTATAGQEAAMAGGDDQALRVGAEQTDFGDRRQALGFVLSGLGSGATGRRRVQVVAHALPRMAAFGPEVEQSHCEVAAHMARRLELGDDVEQSLFQSLDRWDGKGPHGSAGEGIPAGSRFARVATQAVLFHRLGGALLAVRTVGQRAGGMLDPTVAALFCSQGEELLGSLDDLDLRAAVLDAEPEPHRSIAPHGMDEVARAFGDVTDLKSRWFRGHSGRVATLAENACHALGDHDTQPLVVRRAAWLHDIGRVGVRNGIWDRPGPLSSTEWEQVRLHAYHSERVLAAAGGLAEASQLAGMHHERCDGSGYHRQSTGTTATPLGARIIAAADAFAALTSARPHRPAHSSKDAADVLRADASAGRLDARVVDAVLAVAGERASTSRRHLPGGLTEREGQVLALIARGSSTREVASRLVISHKTAEHHVQHIYAKIGVSTRAGAAMFAMEHDLLGA